MALAALAVVGHRRARHPPQVIAFNFTNVIVAWPVGALSDRVGRRGLIAVAWSIYAVTYLGLALASPGFPIVVLWALYGV